MLLDITFNISYLPYNTLTGRYTVIGFRKKTRSTQHNTNTDVTVFITARTNGKSVTYTCLTNYNASLLPAKHRQYLAQTSVASARY